MTHTTTPVIHEYPFEVADGPANMSADEVLLEAAAAGQASLRFYSWHPPTLSLGYFQPEDWRLSDPQLRSLPYVRRASGGATLVHHHELTYALALPAGAGWQRRGESWICRMHHIIGRALTAMNVLVTTEVCGMERKLGAGLCFLHHTPGDLIARDHKIAGSAQRKARGAVLQHGGILLARSPFTPQLPGIAEVAGISLRPADLTDSIRRELVADTGWIVKPTSWTQEQRDRVRELVETKYRSADWNQKR